MTDVASHIFGLCRSIVDRALRRGAGALASTPPCRPFPRHAALLLAAAGAVLAGCASTQVDIHPAPQAPVCDAAQPALLLWAPRWRADQKDVPAREAAAEQGLLDFLAGSRCFAQAQLRRVADTSPAAVAEAAALAGGAAGGPPGAALLVTVTVRELGPVLRIGSPAGIEGGTEVLLDIAVYAPGAALPGRQFSVHWRHGGAGVVKGVASLPADLAAALAAGLRPGP